MMDAISGFVSDWYFWIKAFHLISVIAWLAGLFYLPRLFVYHCRVVGTPADELFQTMERRLLRIIMNPAMIAAWVFGGLLLTVQDWSQGWLHAKLTAVTIITVYHHLLGLWRKDFAAGRNRRPERFYRMVNEIPTLLMMAIVILVIVKPF